tara:strand:- start:187 stop:417 length:231 start_codon:yes stop_codon:yes gene_type:complete
MALLKMVRVQGFGEGVPIREQVAGHTPEEGTYVAFLSDGTWHDGYPVTTDSGERYFISRYRLGQDKLDKYNLTEVI